MDPTYKELSTLYHDKPDEYYVGSRDEMLEFLPRDFRTILDVGCGDGAFGAQIKERSQDKLVWGVEPNAASARVAATQLDRIVNGCFPADMPKESERYFDVITFNDVLEHTLDPESILIESKKYLSPNGVVVASIPNILFFYEMVNILWREDWKYAESGILDKTHLRFFTRKSIERMFDSAGFDVVAINGIHATRGLAYTIVNLLLLNRLKDWKYVQFAVQAMPR